MSLSVIGAGFGRTGTLSLKIALEQLGMGPCYHMSEVFQHPDHVDLWNAAAEGDAADWDVLFSGYAAAVDWPTCYFWRELASHYSDAKILLTVRDPEKWYDSVFNTIYQEMTRPAMVDDPLFHRRLAMGTKIVLERTFDGRFEDRAHAIEVYERHNEEVKRCVPQERLLVYELSEGWTPLCRFLGLPAPEEALPRVNTTVDFRQRMGLDES